MRSDFFFFFGIKMNVFEVGGILWSKPSLNVKMFSWIKKVKDQM